ncbi:MAG: hypothetical protein WC602_05890 [archaeon]
MRKEVYYGVIAGLLLLLAYTALLYALNGPSHVQEQLREFGAFILILAAGFGTQIGLFVYARNKFREKNIGKQMAATSGVSAGTMIACCLHHAADILPFAGLSGIFLFASEATPFFLAIGILSNLVGITAMLAILQRHKIMPFKKILRLPWTEIRNLSVVASIIFLSEFASFLWLLPSGAGAPIQGGISLESKIDIQNNVQVDVAPSISPEQTAFEIKFTTHSGSLDFSVDKIAVLTDSAGKTYNPLKWDGSPPGGHHRSGTLYFAPLPASAKKFSLALSNVGGVDRVFEWNLG